MLSETETTDLGKVFVTTLLGFIVGLFGPIGVWAGAAIVLVGGSRMLHSVRGGGFLAIGYFGIFGFVFSLLFCALFLDGDWAYSYVIAQLAVYCVAIALYLYKRQYRLPAY